MKKQILSAVLTTLISSTALAGSSTFIPFNDLDANKDDGLSAAEAGALPGISEQWETLDIDADGKLTRAEYANYQMPAPAAGIK
jgi:hypothetical protein